MQQWAAVINKNSVGGCNGKKIEAAMKQNG